MGYFSGAMGARDMGLSTMTEGISATGMRDLVDLIEANLLTGVSEKLTETEGMVNAIKNGWQGQARDAFLEKFEAGILSVKKDLNAEYNNLLVRLGELMDDYYDQDKKMMDML